MNQQSSSVLFVTSINSQSKLFIDHIAEQLGCKIVTVAPQDIPSRIEGESLSILLDAEHVDRDIVRHWCEFAAMNQAITLAMFNLSNEDHAAHVLTELHLQGVFYRQDSLETICKGIRSLLAGECWMSRALMTRMISFYRRQEEKKNRSICGLTRRELDVIALLGSGTTNIKIADKLFVSEHTVKSHLYNIFRKIKVRNRIQAISWARQHLSPLEISHRKTSLVRK